MIEHGVTSLIKRDDDPTNDVEETATALSEIVVNTLAEAEGFTHADIVNNEALHELADAIRAQIVVDIRLIRALKPAA